MSECSKCGSPLGEDFGVVNCPSCKTTLLIDIDGQVSVNDSVAVEEVSQVNIQAEQQEGSIEVSDTEEPSDFSSFNPDPMDYTTFEEATQFKASPPPIEDIFNKDEETLEEDIVPEPESEPVAPNDLSDIEQFANANTSILDKGSFTYSLQISGIDSSEIRRSLYEALQDSKFLWNAEDIISQVKGGSLKISELTPIKAYVLVERIKGLPIDISWEQHEIHT